MVTKTVKRNTTKKATVKKAPAKKAVAKKTPAKKITSLDAKIFDAKGKAKSSIKLPENIFGLSWNGDLVHQVVTAIQSNERIPYAHTKDRSEVRGGGAKPWRQKGTGRARHGSRRSPIWTGGGVTFGPRKDRNYTKKANKKMRTKAVYTILSRKFKDGELIFVDNITIGEPKTKDAIATLNALSKNEGFEKLITKPKNTAMILLEERKLNTAKSFRNIKSVYVEEMRNMNPVNLLTYKYIVIENAEAAVKFLQSKVESKSKVGPKAPTVDNRSKEDAQAASKK